MYDVLNRLTEIRTLGEIIQRHAFNRNGEQEAVTEYGVETRYGYTLAGQVRQVFGNGPDRISVLRQEYEYDAARHVVGIRDGEGRVTRRTLDGWGNITALTRLDGLTITYQYDREGRLARQQDRNQRVLDMVYNFNDQLIRRRELSSGEEETYTYRDFVWGNE